MSQISPPPPPPQQRYQIKQVLGKGNFAVVYKAWDTALQRDCAIKRIDPLQYPVSLRKATMRICDELNIMKTVNHRNLLGLYDFYTTPNYTPPTTTLVTSPSLNPWHFGDRLGNSSGCGDFNDGSDEPKYIYLVLEYCNGGTLRDWLNTYRQRQRRHYSIQGHTHNLVSQHPLEYVAFETICRDLLVQIIRGYQVLHRTGIVHRDLKPDNILVSYETTTTLSMRQQQQQQHDPRRHPTMATSAPTATMMVLEPPMSPCLKLADFGLSKIMHSNTLTQTLCGTPLYMAPEIFDGTGAGYSGDRADVWSLGVIAFEILEGCKPFVVNTQRQLLQKIRQNRTLPFTQGAPSLWRNFITHCLQVNVSDRMSWREVFEHPLVESDLSHSCLGNSSSGGGGGGEESVNTDEERIPASSSPLSIPSTMEEDESLLNRMASSLSLLSHSSTMGSCWSTGTCGDTTKKISPSSSMLYREHDYMQSVSSRGAPSSVPTQGITVPSHIVQTRRHHHHHPVRSSSSSSMPIPCDVSSLRYQRRQAKTSLEPRRRQATSAPVVVDHYLDMLFSGPTK